MKYLMHVCTHFNMYVNLKLWNLHTRNHAWLIDIADAHATKTVFLRIFCTKFQKNLLNKGYVDGNKVYNPTKCNIC